MLKSKLKHGFRHIQYIYLVFCRQQRGGINIILNKRGGTNIILNKNGRNIGIFLQTPIQR